MWSLEQKDILISGSHDKTVSNISWSMWYVIYPVTRQAVIWNIRHCKLKQQLCGHTGAVFTVDTDKKAKLAYTGSGDRVMTVFCICV